MAIEHRPTIILADDSMLVRKMITKACPQYMIVEAVNGLEALNLARTSKPDLFLLDIDMPELDGYETCRRLRLDERWKDLPIVFVTGNTDPASIKRAFEVGATDFLRKPIVIGELECRISTQLKLHHQVHENMRYGKEMETLAQERAKQLMHTDRLVTLGTLASGIAHEINNPNTFIRGNAELLGKAIDALLPTLEYAIEHEIGDVSKARFLLKECPKMIADVIDGSDRITEIVKGIKQFAHKSSGFVSIIDVNKCVADSLALCRHRLKKTVVVEQELSGEPAQIQGDSQQIDQVLTNLMVNAADAMTGRERQELMIRTVVEEETIVVSIADTGIGIPQRVIDQIWDPFFTTKEVGKGTGLGLSLVMRIVEDHGGTIEPRTAVGKGTEFVMTFPRPESLMQRQEESESRRLPQAA